MQGRQGQRVPESPRPVHGPWHGLLASKLIGDMHEASSNVEQTRYPVMTRLAKNSVDTALGYQQNLGFPNECRTK